MKQSLLLILFCAVVLKSAAQQRADITRRTDSVTAEGKTLYLSEMASWYGTDIFVERCKDKLPNAGGYLSYDTGIGMNNIFYSKDATPRVLATMSFHYDVRADDCRLDTTQRKMLPTELEYFTIRKAAMDALYANKDSIFHFYKNTGTNPIPIIINGEKRVYILTSPKESGEIIFGNDYLFRFSNDNQITATKSLHKNLMTIRYGKSASDTSKKEEALGVHTHLAQSGDFISATDICTLLLYERFTTWKQYYVISPTFVSIWDCKKNELFALTKTAWDKINADQKERHPPAKQ